MIAGTVWDPQTRHWMTVEDWVALNRERDGDTSQTRADS